MKILILVEANENIGPDGLAQYLQSTLQSNIEYDGHYADVERVDVEGVDGVTREDILVDILGADGSEAAQVELGRRLGAALARKDRQ